MTLKPDGKQVLLKFNFRFFNNNTQYFRDSTYLMLQRFLHLKDALIATLAIREYEIQLVKADWLLMEKIVHSLGSFKKVIIDFISGI